MLKQQCCLANRHSSDWLNPLIFYILICSIFPLALPLNTDLQPLAAGIIWTALMLSSLLSTETLFRHDFNSGLLEQVVLSSFPLWQWALYKVLAHWLLVCLPMLLLAPLLAVMLSLPMTALDELILSMLFGSLGLHLVAAMGAALVVGVPAAAMLLTLIILPLYTPLLIFSVSLVSAEVAGIDNNALLWLLSLVLLALTLVPLAIAASLKLSLSIQ